MPSSTGISIAVFSTLAAVSGIMFTNVVSVVPPTAVLDVRLTWSCDVAFSEYSALNHDQRLALLSALQIYDRLFPFFLSLAISTFCIANGKNRFLTIMMAAGFFLSDTVENTILARIVNIFESGRVWSAAKLPARECSVGPAATVLKWGFLFPLLCWLATAIIKFLKSGGKLKKE